MGLQRVLRRGGGRAKTLQALGQMGCPMAEKDSEGRTSAFFASQMPPSFRQSLRQHLDLATHAWGLPAHRPNGQAHAIHAVDPDFTLLPPHQGNTSDYALHCAAETLAIIHPGIFTA